ncbi:hypothetical protein O181_089654, partial [Austropuccinia psidii MF-1]|nr:hypothetical protein [Austropuccinia psidii MF-1]
MPDGSPYALDSEVWVSIEFMEPILSLFEGACNLFQQNAPIKHLVVPVYSSLLNKLYQYACDSPPAWSQACHAAMAKLHKYNDYEMENNNTLIATLLDPSYHQGIICLIGVSPAHAKEVIDVLSQECMITTSVSPDEYQDTQSSPAQMAELLCQKLLKKYDSAIKCTSALATHSNNLDEVLIYLQHHHPIMADENILSYWKCPILTGNSPELGKIALHYL